MFIGKSSPGAAQLESLIRSGLETVFVAENTTRSARVLLFGLAGRGAAPLRPGDTVPVRVVRSTTRESVLSLRGLVVRLEAGNLPAGATLEANVVSASENPVLRLQIPLSPPRSDDPLGPLMRLASGLGGQVEGQQPPNPLSPQQPAGVELEFPLQVGQESAAVRVAIQPDSEAPSQGSDSVEDRGGYRILFLLDLKSLGPARVDAYAAGQALKATLYMERPQAVEDLRRRLPELRRRLGDRGFTEVRLDVREFRRAARSDRRRFEVFDSGKPPSTVRLIDMEA